jgi:Holliday junction resolvasome RuvABC endonuclease subunit
MKAIRVAALDPSLSNFAVARLVLKLETLQFGIISLHTIRTEKVAKAARKIVRQNSDDLRRCQEIINAYRPLVADCTVVFAEIPTGAQDARAMWSFGAATMAVAACPVPVIQVQPSETKLATVGTKTASKEEMIEWAAAAYPGGPWVRYERDIIRKGKLVRKKGDIMDDEEHVADAMAVAHAGIQTDQFKQLLAMWRAAPAQAA